MANPLASLLRAAYGFSPAALRALLQNGPGGARRVIGATLGAAAKRPRVPALDMWDLVRAFPADSNISIHAGDWTDGCTAPLERFLMAQLVRHFQPRLILEIGTYRGTTTRLLLENAPADARIYTIDLPPAVDPAQVQNISDERLVRHREVGVQLRAHPLSERVTQVYGNTFDAATWEAVPTGVEFAFIDASHSYEAVRNDTERTRAKLAPNAVIMWHDYSHGESAERGVGRYIRELMTQRDNVFICPQTDVAFEIPRNALLAGLDRIPSWYPDGDYARRHPGGAAPWIDRAHNPSATNSV